MKRVNNVSSIIYCVFAIAFIFTMGCGGGGVTGSGAGGSSSLTYSGLRTQAAISEDNAAVLAEGAYEGGTFSAALSTSASGVSDPQQESRLGHPLPLQLPQILEKSLHNMNLESRDMINGAVVNLNFALPGTCGGSVSYSIHVDAQTNEFSGQMVFSNDYCEDDLGMSGNVHISGEIDIDTREFATLHFSFDGITVTEENTSNTIAGDVYINVSGSALTVTENLLARDNADNKVYWWDYDLSITEGVYKEFRLSGRYYDPDYGYVTISTPTPFRVAIGQQTPSEGVLLLTGRDDTFVQLTILSSSTYQIDRW